ncbi:MAG TPA: LamG-like jellyroll fold domain-containing protein [Ignavibacteriaceae bacterium]|nr:LamG-like jellyroll fold domain-containing protein [Ignavibacteriaceae bacterium]
MKHTIRFRLLVIFSLLLLPCVMNIYAQEVIGGPYTPDSHTMLLLHFDGNLDNASSYSANAIGHTNAPNGIFYLPNSFDTDLGQVLGLTNDAQSDSSYVTVADTSYLDLTGDWTIEGWINIFTFGQTSGDWRWVPRLVIKTGDDVFWRPNYFVEMWGDYRFFSTGYNVSGADRWPQVNSPNNILQVGQWYHLTFIRDTSRHILIQMVHNAQRQLISFTTAPYDAVLDDPPITTSQPVHIGFAGGGDDSFLDGFVDEIRISDNVRDFPVPPIITDVTELPNQTSSVPEYEVDANIMAFAVGGSITSADIKYSTDNGTTWQSTAMSDMGNNQYTGFIPQQPLGTIINYYVEATDDQNRTAQYPAEGNGYLTFAVYQPMALVLNLDFEGGSGTPVDHSFFHSPVSSPRPFVYSSDAAEGSYSIVQAPDPDGMDSSFMRVNSPFLTSPDFNVSLWFKADSLSEYTRIINRPITDGNWYQNNYEIRTEPGNHLRARYYADPAVIQPDYYVEMDLMDTIQIDTWYRVIFKRDSTHAVFQLFDANNNLIDETENDSTIADYPPVPATAPLRIGNGGNLSGARGFSGKIDQVLVYNNFEAENTTGVKDDNTLIPGRYELSQNYPNPFNPTTTIKFGIPKAGQVVLVVYDILGRKIKTLLNENTHVGYHSVVWDGTNDYGNRVSTGIYFYQLNAGSTQLTQKMILLK